MKKPQDPFADFEARWREQKKAWLRGSYTDDEIKLPARRGIEPETEPEPIQPRIDTGQHTLLLADSGAGKTNVIRWYLYHLIPQIAAGKHTAILIDPMDKGVLTEDLLRLKSVYDLQDKAVVIEPFDSPASINIFQLYDDSNYALEQAKAKVERTLGTVAISVTANQNIPFKHALNAVFALPEEDRDIFKLQQILAKGIADLPVNRDRLMEATQRYYDSYTKNARAEEMVEKLNSFLDSHIFAALFSTKQKPFDIFEHCQQGKLIIIDCSRAPQIYGQFWIEEVAATIGRRLALLKRRKPVVPVTLFIDEAQEYIGNNQPFARLLNKAREAELSAFVALHNLAQDIEPNVMHALVQQTHVKFVARTYDHLTLLCRTMGKTQQELIGEIPDYHFAYYNRRQNMESAEIINLGVVDFRKMPQCTPEQTEELRRLARPQEDTAVPPAPPREERRSRQSEQRSAPKPQSAPKEPDPPPEIPKTETDGQRTWTRPRRK